jgi:hypothetical protein
MTDDERLLDELRPFAIWTVYGALSSERVSARSASPV